MIILYGIIAKIKLINTCKNLTTTTGTIPRMKYKTVLDVIGYKLVSHCVSSRLSNKKMLTVTHSQTPGFPFLSANLRLSYSEAECKVNFMCRRF